MKYAAVFLATGFEEIEALTVVDILRRAGIETATVPVTGEKTVTGSHGIPVIADKLLSEIDFVDVSVPILPGGMPGTNNLEACDALMKEIDAFFASGKPIAAICAAPRILGHRGILKGREATVYPGNEDQLEGAIVTGKKVAVAGNIITANGMGSAIDFALAIVELLTGDKALAEKIGKAIMYLE